MTLIHSGPSTCIEHYPQHYTSAINHTLTHVMLRHHYICPYLYIRFRPYNMFITLRMNQFHIYMWPRQAHKSIKPTRRTLLNLWSALLTLAHLCSMIAIRCSSGGSMADIHFARRPRTRYNSGRRDLSSGICTMFSPRGLCSMESLHFIQNHLPT